VTSLFFLCKNASICVTWLFICVTRLIHMCDITHLYVCDTTHSHVWNDWFICMTWRIRRRRHGFFICATRCHTFEYVISFTGLIRMCVTWSFIRMTCLIHKCNMNHSYVKHDSFVTWLINMRDTVHAYVWHNTFICAWHDHLYVWHVSFIRATWLIRMWNMTLSW